MLVTLLIQYLFQSLFRQSQFFDRRGLGLFHKSVQDDDAPAFHATKERATNTFFIACMQYFN